MRSSKKVRPFTVTGQFSHTQVVSRLSSTVVVTIIRDGKGTAYNPSLSTHQIEIKACVAPQSKRTDNGFPCMLGR